MGRSSAQPRHLAPTRQNIFKTMAFMLVAALVLAGTFVSLQSTSASATDKTGGSNPTCTTEYEWVKKGTEYRWKTVYKEAKQLKGWYVELPNTWKQGDPNTWYDLPSEKQPPRSDQVAPTGTVPLSVYGGPRNVSTQYQYKTSFTEFFPSETGFSAGPPPAGKDWGNPIAQQSVIVDGPKWSATSPGQGWEKTGKSKQVNCFDWDWKYDNPTCTALTVKYPSNIPDGQANDANIRIVNLGPGGGEVNLNFHNNNGTWSGTKSFVYAEHPNWPGWTYYKVVWTQVGGTNYHWQGEVTCGNPPTPKDASASVSVDTQATCTDPSTVTFDLVNATLDSEPVNTPGEHQIGVTATDGHLFADGTNKTSMTYVIEDKKPGQSTDPKGECYVPPTPKVCVAFEDGPTATNLDEAGWNHNDTRSTGEYEYVNGGIRLFTTDTDNPGSGQNKVTLYRAVDPTPLAEFGEPSVEFLGEGTGVRPGMQVGVDVNGDGTFDGYLVGEPWSYGEHNWWTNKAGFNVSAGMGYASFGSWADFVAANPQAKVVSVGLSLGSGVLGDWTVKSFTANCVTYTFDHKTEVVKDAVAETKVKEQPTCTETSVIDFTIENATWDSEPDLTVGTHTRKATANDGHLFADGSKTAEVEYTIEDKNPDLCEPVVVPNNGQYSIQQGCVASEDNNVGGGYVTFTFTNVVELKEGEVTTDAEFTYTDENGETQTVTVPANEVVVRTVVFPEDSGDHVVLVGLAGEEQEEVVVSTDCKPNPTPFTPPAPTFVDKCGLTDDGVAVIGTPVEAASSIDQDGNIHRSAVYSTDEGVFFVSDNTIGGKRDATVWFVVNTENVFIPEPGANDTYVLEDGVAVWHYSFTNEACPTPTPTPTPTANPTAPSGAPTPAAPAPKPKQHSGLAVTGAEALTGLGVALSLLLGGGALVVRQRRKRNA